MRIAQLMRRWEDGVRDTQQSSEPEVERALMHVRAIGSPRLAACLCDLYVGLVAGIVPGLSSPCLIIWGGGGFAGYWFALAQQNPNTAVYKADEIG
jgi:hypothetical protein